MTTPTRVMITSCETGPGAWRHQEEIIRAHFPANDPQFVTTEDPAAADIIFLGNIRNENDYAKLRANELVRRFPRKTFAISDGDEVRRYCQGILTSLTNSPWNLGRFRSGSYFLFHPDFKNPHVERWYAGRGDAGREPRPEKKYLASFSGRNCLPLRDRLLRLQWQREDVYIRDTTYRFDNFTHQPMGKGPEQESYFNIAIRSKFMLCPRGNGAASIRFFEAMQLGVVPVLISDDWVLPEGPDWNRCLLRVPESALDSLEATLLRHEADADAMGARAQQAYTAFFHGEAYVRYLIAAAQSIAQTHTAIPETWFRLGWKPTLLARKVHRRFKRVAASAKRPTPVAQAPSPERPHAT